MFGVPSGGRTLLRLPASCATPRPSTATGPAASIGRPRTVVATGFSERACRYGLQHLIGVDYVWSPQRGRYRLTQRGRVIAAEIIPDTGRPRRRAQLRRRVRSSSPDGASSGDNGWGPNRGRSGRVTTAWLRDIPIRGCGSGSHTLSVLDGCRTRTTRVGRCIL